MTRIAYITNASPTSGVGHQAEEIKKNLSRHAEVAVTEWRLDGLAGSISREGEIVQQLRPWPAMMGKKSVMWLRLGRTLPSLLSDTTDIIHATNQSLSFITVPGAPSVVTVHDLIEVLEPQQRGAQWLSRYLYQGIPRAAALIAVSHYTAQTIVDYYQVPRERIHVIPNGVSTVFYPLPDWSDTLAYRTLRHELKLQDNDRILLYVGSEHPRKNTAVLLQVLAHVRSRGVAAVLLKVGDPGIGTGRAELLALADTLKVRPYLRFVGTVGATRLNELYNLADVFVYPSRFEGFGLPPLQAMATGTPVVVSNATSLPEVVGDAGILCDPDDVGAFITGVQQLLEDPALAAQKRAQGLRQAQKFSWVTAAEQVTAVYRQAVA